MPKEIRTTGAGNLAHSKYFLIVDQGGNIVADNKVRTDRPGYQTWECDYRGGDIWLRKVYPSQDQPIQLHIDRPMRVRIQMRSNPSFAETLFNPKHEAGHALFCYALRHCSVRAIDLRISVILEGNLHTQIKNREIESLRLSKAVTSPDFNGQDLTNPSAVQQLAAACQGLGGIAGCQGNQSGADNDLLKVNALITFVSNSASARKEGLGQTARRLLDELQALANEIIADPVVAPRHKALAEALVAKGCLDQTEIENILVPATLPDYSGRIEEIAKRFNIPLVERAPIQGLIF
jgi:hypothetical protein